MENPTKIHDLGGNTLIFGNTHIAIKKSTFSIKKEYHLPNGSENLTVSDLKIVDPGRFTAGKF